MTNWEFIKLGVTIAMSSRLYKQAEQMNWIIISSPEPMWSYCTTAKKDKQTDFLENIVIYYILQKFPKHYEQTNGFRKYIDHK